ncbi:MAG: hypothetical protein IPM57_09785 [Oligoflexia bacterium]|nr:hypothetical protein [Oligoflexia bacterium]
MGLEFNFSGLIAPSKSELIRALCLKTWNKDISFDLNSSGEDVNNMVKAVKAFYNQANSFFCGDSALMLRLFSTRLSRLEGEFILSGSNRLFERPHQALWETLGTLGCDLKQSGKELKMKSQGWNKNATHVYIESSLSSQYLSALTLNSWQLKNDITWDYSKLSSTEYLNITLNFLKKSGLEFEKEQNKIHIKKNQTPQATHFQIEPDMSTAFTVAAWAVVGGYAEIKNFPTHSHQPDFIFTQILKDMGVEINFLNQMLLVKKTKHLNTINLDLLNTPDLFPVLSTLCAFTDGVSVLKNVKHVALKESNRIEKTKELLSLINCQTQFDGTNFIISGNKNLLNQTHNSFTFNADHDHRMVMAAQVLKFAGIDISILNSNAINKTAPELLSYVC